MALADLIILALAAGAVIDVVHNGSIFATSRATLQATQDAADPDDWRQLWWELLQCPFCQSYYVPVYFALLLAFALPSWVAILQPIVLGLAATRLSNLINSLLPLAAQYKRPHV